MNGTKQRINFIMEYISAYEKKIKLANKNGLYDEAKLFELFAQDICKVWFGQNFINLNLIKQNYPCVDLISADKSIYVQVSTQTDIMKKIKDTLNALNSSSAPELTNISSPVFFVLSNKSESSVKDLVGNKQIGKYSFTVKDNFISSSKVVQRAMTDLDFQKELYELLKKDVEGLDDITNKLLFQFDQSKSVGLFNIDTTINKEYEIDRVELINRIKTDDNQFVFVCGDAGSGKSALCKKIMQDEEKILFARADKLVMCNSINDIWGIDLIKAFQILKKERLVIYIDALEYIATAGYTVKELLQSLLNEIKKHPNLRFMTSCRTSDLGAFFRLSDIFNIKKYVIEAISNKELKGIMKKYPVIRKMADSDKYAELIRSPFYINEIVSKNINIDTLSDVNSFRSFIWEECICVRNKARERGIPTNDVVRVIKHIVLERSKSFTLGISEDMIDLKIMELLRSNNVITEKNSLVRLKFDIYEDICFEKLFDDEFEFCKGVYKVFFENIEKMGKGAYRRYQIWISNKLLAKENRDKFLYALIFSDGVSQEWHRNTIIGLIKSPFCKSFFDEQGHNMIEKGVLSEFVDNTNCFGFEMGDLWFNDNKSICKLILRACGYGRLALIDLIYDNEMYKSGELQRNKIVKLCNDYIWQSQYGEKQAESVCKMICFYLDKYFENDIGDYDHRIVTDIGPLLHILYSLPVNANTWISNFWERIKELYLDEDVSKSRIAESIMSWTLDNVTEALVDNKIFELLELTSTLWMAETSKDKRKREIYGIEFGDDSSWGIHGCGENYSHSYTDIENDLFLRVAFKRNYKVTMEWALLLINRAVSEYMSNHPENVCEIVIFDYENNMEKTYYGNSAMWYAGREDYMIPSLIGDIVYWMRETVIELLRSFINDKKRFVEFAYYVKTMILNKSTNIIPLTLIEDLAFEFSDMIPGYAIILGSNIDLIYYDIEWQAHKMRNPIKDILYEQIKMQTGIPSFKSRYSYKEYKFNGLQNYIAWSQVNEANSVKINCHTTLDYLYGKINKNDARALLQVQKMDMRNAEVTVQKSDLIYLEPRLSEETLKLVNENDDEIKREREVISCFQRILEDGNYDDLTTVVSLIDHIISFMDSPNAEMKYENYYIMALVIALKNPNLPKDKRDCYICDWVERIENFITNRKSYVADIKLTIILFDQYRSDIDCNTRNKLKKLMLECLLDFSHTASLRGIVENYLLRDRYIARVCFNTIIGIAEDERIRSSYNRQIIEENKNKEYKIPASYGIPKPDDIILALGLEPYKSKYKKIVERYLYNEEVLDINSINVDKLDPGYLFVALNTGLTLSDKEFYDFVKKTMAIYIQSTRSDDSNSVMDTYYQRIIFKNMLRREIMDSNNIFKVVDLMFDDMDFKQFNTYTIRDYSFILGYIHSIYFDSYGDKDKRRLCQRCLEYLEPKIDAISVPYVKKELQRIMLFSSDYSGNPIELNNCETHYSFDDKIFLCRLWDKYCVRHEQETIYAIFSMKIDELLPEVIPVVYKTVESMKKDKEVEDANCKVIIETLLLKALFGYSDIIKTNKELHDAYEGLLGILINYGNECAAVVLDEYRTH